MRPDEMPPPERFSISPRSLEKLVPVPEPYLKTRDSFFDEVEDRDEIVFADWMKQAETCGRDRRRASDDG